MPMPKHISPDLKVTRKRGDEQFPVDADIMKAWLKTDNDGDLVRMVVMNDHSTTQSNALSEYIHGNDALSIDAIDAFSFRAAPLGSEHQQDIDTFVGSFPQSFVSPQSATWTRGVYTPTAARKRLYKATDPDDSTRLIGMLLEQDTNGRLRQVAWYKAQESSVIFQSTPSSLDFELVRDHNGAPTTDPSYIGGWTWYYCTSV